MPPDDPLGRHGPSLDNFLRKKPLSAEHRKQPCPYGKSPSSTLQSPPPSSPCPLASVGPCPKFFLSGSPTPCVPATPPASAESPRPP